MVNLRPRLRPKHSESSLSELLNRILDKGVVIDAKVRISLGECELLYIEATIILASFRTAVNIGLDFPTGTDLNAPGWREAVEKEQCPQCAKLVASEGLRDGCPWCGYAFGEIKFGG